MVGGKPKFEGYTDHCTISLSTIKIIIFGFWKFIEIFEDAIFLNLTKH